MKDMDRWTAFNLGRAVEKGVAFTVEVVREGWPAPSEYVAVVTSVRSGDVYVDVAGVKMVWTWSGAEGEEPRGWITSKQPANWHTKSIWKGRKKLRARP